MNQTGTDEDVIEDVIAWQDAFKSLRYLPRTMEQKLGYLVEECGEVLAAVGKTQRWGLESRNPEVVPSESETNARWILREMDDLELAIGIARRALLVSCPSEGATDDAAERKIQISVKDTVAQDLLWEYAQRRRAVASATKFSDDLEAALVKAGFERPVMRHVDDFLDDIHSDPYACWIINHFRLPAIHKARFARFMDIHRLFCTYDGKRYRVIGASRMCDVWLTADFSRDHGYDHRVDPMKCSAWSPSP